MFLLSADRELQHSYSSRAARETDVSDIYLAQEITLFVAPFRCNWEPLGVASLNGPRGVTLGEFLSPPPLIGKVYCG